MRKLALAVVLTAALPAFAQTVEPLAVPTIETVAGTGVEGFSGDGGPATDAQLGDLGFVATDRAGNLYFADYGNNRIRRVDAETGIITTVAGNGSRSYGGDGGLATEAQLNAAFSLELDSRGNLYIAESVGHRIRRVDAETGIITTVAGTGTGGYSGDGGLATAAQINRPYGLGFDRQGNLYIGDHWNNRIRRVDTAGIITTYAGTGANGYGGDGGQATAAQLNYPVGLDLDSQDNLYIADTWNRRVRRVDAETGIITTYAGTGASGHSGDGGQATAAQLDLVESVAVDKQDNLYITNYVRYRIRKVDAETGIITTLAGTGAQGYGGDGGPATSANLNDAWDVAIDPLGNVYIGDGANHRVRLVRQFRLVPLAFESGVADKRFAVGRPIALFQVPAAVGGEGAARYAARGLPPGLLFDADGRGQCGLPRAVCGTPTETGRHTVTVEASDAGSGRATLTFAVEVANAGDVDAGPPAALADAALREAVARALSMDSGAVTEADLLALSELNAAWLGVSSLEGLAAASNLRRLELGGNAVSDISELSRLRLLDYVDLSDNAVSDLSALSGLTRLETLLLSGNRVEDLSPLRGMTALRSLFLDGNAVSDLTLASSLESLEELSLSGNPLGGLSPLCALRKLTRLWLAAAGLSDISELSCLSWLERLWLSDNAVADVSPLAGMRELAWLDLERNAVADAGPLRSPGALARLRLGSNRVADAGPLAANAGLGTGDVVGLRGNPLSEASIERHVPALRGRGVAVLAGLSSPWFAASADAAGRQSFARLINRSDMAGEALLWGVDDAGARFGPARLAIGAGRTAHVNSDDLERGNAAKGLAGGLGAPTSGGWRLEVLSTLDLEAQTFLRASGGPPSALHDALPRTGDTLSAAFLPARRERSPAGALRVSNPTGRDETVRVWGVDDAGRGRLATGLAAPAGRAVTVTAAELESWRFGAGRGLGRGEGNWRLELTAPWPLEAQALATGDGGRVGNLSDPAAALGSGAVARAPLFPPASAVGRVGVARVWNLSAAAGVVRVVAVDDAGVRAKPVELGLEAFETVEFDSGDLEEGGGPVSEGVGAPTRGSWRLELRADFGARARVHARGAGGYATGLLESAPRSDGAARVSVFNPGSNRAQRGLLRLVNDGAEDAAATIAGVDDAGDAGGEVSVTVPAGEALWLSAAELESGGAGFEGSLGDGEGKWRLTVASSVPLTVMSLVEDEDGALSNLSTPGRR